MTEKIGTVKNPLTVIAIFAGIAEVSGTVVLPFIAEENQLVFIYFLLSFPSILVFFFFITLNLNNKALYAPSDFNNEENYIKIFKYDVSKQEKIEVKISQEELMKIVNDDLIDLKDQFQNQFQKFEFELKSLRENPQATKSSKATKPKVDVESNTDDYIENYDETPGLVSINNFPDAKAFQKILQRKGYETELYGSISLTKSKYSEHQTIWVGKKFPSNEAIEIILLAKQHFPHLKYIDYSGHKATPPKYIHDQMFIGGATETAEERELTPLTENDWKRLRSIKTGSEFDAFIKSFQG